LNILLLWYFKPGGSQTPLDRARADEAIGWSLKYLNGFAHSEQFGHSPEPGSQAVFATRHIRGTKESLLVGWRNCSVQFCNEDRIVGHLADTPRVTENLPRKPHPFPREASA